MNVNFYLDWRKGVDNHYGNLDNFSDAPTIRNMRKTLVRALDEQESISKSVVDEDARKEFDSWFETEVVIGKKAVAEFDEWLEKRGLPL